MARPIIIVLLLVMLFCAPAAAFRPLLTEDEPAIGRGTWRLESGVEYSKPRTTSQISTNISTLTYGLLPHLDLGLQVPYSLTYPGGMEDVVIRLKYDFLPGRVGLFSAFKFANGDTSLGLGTGQTSFSLLAVFSKKIGPSFIHCNLGGELVGKPAGSTLRDKFIYRLAFEHPFRDYGSFVTEIVGATQSDPAIAASPLELLVGIAKYGYERLQIDLSASVGLTDASPAYKYALGFMVLL